MLNTARTTAIAMDIRRRVVRMGFVEKSATIVHTVPSVELENVVTRMANARRVATMEEPLRGESSEAWFSSASLLPWLAVTVRAARITVTEPEQQ